MRYIPTYAYTSARRVKTWAVPFTLALALPACATTQVQTAQTQIARYYADYALIKAGVETAIATVPAVALRADQIHAWEARIEQAFAAARAAGDVAAAYAALHEAQTQANVSAVVAAR